jgi:hypothetical protein
MTTDTDIKFAAILGFMGQQRDRFQVFGPPYSLEEKVERAAQVEHCGAVELVYPRELDDIARIKNSMSLKYRQSISRYWSCTLCKRSPQLVAGAVRCGWAFICRAYQ